jgi:DNA-binding CsgD family transcriptional regulator
MAGCCSRTVRRVRRAYGRGGLGGLATADSTSVSDGAPFSTSHLAGIKRAMRGRRFAGLDAFRSWLHVAFGLWISRSEARWLLYCRLGVDAPWVEAVSESVELDAEPTSIAITTIAGLMGGIELTPRVDSWCEGFRALLAPMLPEADRLSIALGTDTNLGLQSHAPSTVERTWHVTPNGTSADPALMRCDDHPRRVDRMLPGWRAQGVALELFEAPVGVDYYVGAESIGMIALWRRRGAHGFTATTYAILDALEPFVLASMQGYVAWLQRSQERSLFRGALQRLCEATGMTRREEEVLVLYVSGCARCEIAVQLDITEATLKAHLHAIHAKAGTSSDRALIGKFLAPELR